MGPVPGEGVGPVPGEGVGPSGGAGVCILGEGVWLPVNVAYTGTGTDVFPLVQSGAWQQTGSLGSGTIIQLGARFL